LTQETEEEMIERRSKNADATIGFLFQAYDWFWILAGIVFGLFLLGIWLFG